MTHSCPFTQAQHFLSIFCLFVFCYRYQESPHCPCSNLVPAAPPSVFVCDRRRVCRLPAVWEVQGARAGEAGIGDSTQTCWSLGGRSKVDHFLNAPKLKCLKKGNVLSWSSCLQWAFGQITEIISLLSRQTSLLSPDLPLVSPRALSRNFLLLKSSEFMPYIGAGILAVYALLILRMSWNGWTFRMWVSSHQEPDWNNQIPLLLLLRMLPCSMATWWGQALMLWLHAWCAVLFTCASRGRYLAQSTHSVNIENEYEDVNLKIAFCAAII